MSQSSGLSNIQMQSVMYNEGPSLIVAGAGSGKTLVLTYKIAYLLSIGLKPQNILAITFTNKAAREMKERIAKIVGYDQAKYISMGTFHSRFSIILRTDGEAIGLDRNFTVYDTSDSQSLVKSIINELQLDEKKYKPKNVLARISNAKNNLVSTQDYMNSVFNNQDFELRIPSVFKIYAEYERRCQLSNAIDFDDMLFLTNKLFKEHPHILEKYQDGFQFILVDEYQDTNSVQHEILKLLATKHNRICVVGDDAQSIYGFRGANIDNILNFQRTYPNSKVFKLEQNYRSTKSIVNAANSLIEKNSKRIKKVVFSENEAGDKVKVITAPTDIDESIIIAKQIKQISAQQGVDYSHFAVLYRTNAQSRIIEKNFNENRIPYIVYGGTSFYQRKDIKDIIAYLRLCVNNNDEEAFKRIINYPARGLGKTTINKVFELALKQQVSLFEIILNPLSYNLNVSAATATKLTAFANMIKSLSAKVYDINAYQLVEKVIESSSIIKVLKENNDKDSQNSIELIQELVSDVYQSCESKLTEDNEILYLPEYLQMVSLQTDLDKNVDNELSRVTLMTVHAAKGLEFDNIFIVGVEEEFFPYYLSVSDDDVQEERRLMYVAITRAAKKCVLTHCSQRMRNGKIIFPTISRFINDIDNQLLDKRESNIPKPIDFSAKNESFFSKPFWGRHNTQQSTPPKVEPIVQPRKLVKLKTDNAAPVESINSAIKAGMKIEHERFGIGEVCLVENTSNGERMKVNFKETGEKILLLKFAKFKIIE